MVVEVAGGGEDTLETSISATLGANLENLVLSGSGDFDLTGNALDNRLTGNAGNNFLDGQGGRDTYSGGMGNDTFLLDSLDERVDELAGGGTDTVEAGFSYTLGAELENLRLTGAAGLTGVGNLLNNVLTGNSGANTLNGKSGVDTLAGGLGNDTYYVETAGEVITEQSGEGTDTVYSTVSWTLASNVERLYLRDGYATALDGTGNAEANRLSGNALGNVLRGEDGADTLLGGGGNDRLDGGTGVDSLTGGTGDDTYVADLATDRIIEVSGEGVDTVESSLSWTLGSWLENLTLTGAGALNGRGNSLDNVLTGNVAANTLRGEGGRDTLAGGGGSDTYYVDSADDEVVELSGEGNDSVYSTGSYTLGANVERLYLFEGYAGAVSAAGNGEANVLNGNSGSNLLQGLGGNDTLSGKLGNDTYVFGRGDGQDTVTDTDATAGNADELSFLAGVDHDQLWFQQADRKSVV
jgi:Ca2+-binding RTX toxin-like protein